MIKFTAVLFAICWSTNILHAEQYRLYGADGKSLGTASTSGNVTTYRNERGNVTGTATKDSAATTLRDPRGNVTTHIKDR